MAFFKFRQRGQPQPAPEPSRRPRANEPAAAGPQETVDSLRRRARHRLVGAAVLVMVAVIGFPLLFDTQPRPVAVDAPITIPDKDRAAPLRVPDAAARNGQVSASASLGDREEMVAANGPSARRPASAPVASGRTPAPAPRADGPSTRSGQGDTAAASSGAQAQREADATARREREQQARAQREDEARHKREEAARARRDEEAARRESDATARAEREDDTTRKREEAAKAKREQEAKAKREAETRAKREEAARARALLEGRGGAAAASDKAADAKAGRYIVQIGAFADDAAAHEARQKAERAGLKTYTQVVDTRDGKRTRVRVGPFNGREDADKAAAALKKAGLGGSVLAL